MIHVPVEAVKNSKSAVWSSRLIVGQVMQLLHPFVIHLQLLYPKLSDFAEKNKKIACASS